MKNKNRKKVTVLIPEDLLADAKRASNLNTTNSIIQGLRLLQASGAYTKLRKLRGQVRFSLNLDELREDRR